ncbi:MAG: hypothetical protein LBD06_02855 [Candidatus Accumulibacter sp.]|nr:hypothetical protein [Accumulibacter sp.]
MNLRRFAPFRGQKTEHVSEGSGLRAIVSAVKRFLRTNGNCFSAWYS